MRLLNTSLFSDPNLAGYYTLEDALADAGGVNLTNNGTVTFTSAKYVNGANFGASNTTKYLSTTNALGIDGGNISLSLWVQANGVPSSGNSGTIVAQENVNSDVNYQINYWNDGGTMKIRFRRVRQGISIDVGTVTHTIATSGFDHIVMTYDGTNIRGYINNSLVVTAAASGNGGGALNNGFYIGADSNAGTKFSGIVDDVGIFSKVLSVGEIDELFQDIVPPTVTTETPATNITSNSAQGGGNVTDDGLGTISERGVVWGTSSNPTTAGNKQSTSGTTGAFSSVNMTGLLPDTLYYYRAYAINEAGTSYGDNVTFTTQDAVISGTCTLNGNPIENVIVTLINSDTDAVVGTDLSDVSGNYEFAGLDITATYHVVAEYMDGYDMYNTRSLPFMTPEEV